MNEWMDGLVGEWTDEGEWMDGWMEDIKNTKEER